MREVMLQGTATDVFGLTTWTAAGSANVVSSSGTTYGTALLAPTDESSFYSKNIDVLNAGVNDFEMTFRFYFGEKQGDNNGQQLLFAISNEKTWMDMSCTMIIYDAGWYEGKFQFAKMDDTSQKIGFGFYVETNKLSYGWHVLKITRQGTAMSATMDGVDISTLVDSAKYYGIFRESLWYSETDRLSELPSDYGMDFSVTNPTMFLMGGCDITGSYDAWGFTYGQLDYFDYKIFTNDNNGGKISYAYII